MRVRTKKKIMREDGRYGKAVPLSKSQGIRKSSVTTKDIRFKGEPFLREVKEVYTELINRYIADPEQHLKVFDKNSVYLPTKKIGKNNPKEGEIKADNAARQEWNRTEDKAKEIRHLQNTVLPNLKEQLADTKGIFKGKDRKALTERHSERVRKNRRYGISHAAAYIKILFEF